MKKIVSLILIVCAVGFSSIICAESKTLFEVKVFNVTGLPLADVIEDRSGLELISHPKVITGINTPAFIKMTTDDDLRLLLSMKMTPLDDETYEYEYEITNQGAVNSSSKGSKVKKINDTWMLIVNLGEQKVILEVLAKNIEEVVENKVIKSTHGLMSVSDKHTKITEEDCGIVSVFSKTLKKNHYQVAITKIDGKINRHKTIIKLKAGTHQLLMAAFIPEDVIKNKKSKMKQMAKIEFMVLPNKKYYLGAYFDPFNKDESSDGLWKPYVWKIEDSECRIESAKSE